MSRRRGWIGALIVLVPVAAAGQDATGESIYRQWCAGCHGDQGDGQGDAAAYMLPQPRDFTRALYQIRTTGSGELPTDDDLRRVIEDGMPGSTMPGWRDKLSTREIDLLVDYLKTFNRFFDGPAPQPMSFGKAPGGPSADDLVEGRRLYLDELECYRCHGDQGRGDGPSAPPLTDDWDFPVLPADLSENWNFNGGGTVEDIYRRLRTGLDGTPMPSNNDVVEAEIITDEQLWRVAQYVRSLSPAEAPRRRDVIRAGRVEALPAAPDDSMWDAIEPYYIPLAGQITIAPRWFVPSVDGLWVRAAHDGDSLVLHLEWNDPNRSPDPEWEERFEGIRRTLAPVDRAHRETQGPDRVAVYTPLTPPEGTELPYFLAGDARNPVAMTVWTSAPDGLAEGTATGLGTFSGAPVTGRHGAVFEAGRWRLALRRSLVGSDTAFELPPGENVPIAFQISNGTAGEDDVRSAVSAWYAVYLDVPTPGRVFVAPIVAVILSAGLGFLTVWRAQRRERRA